MASAGTRSHCASPLRRGDGLLRRRGDGWRYRELGTSHRALQTAPRELADVLVEIATLRG
jgi:hypothetical protein